MLDAVVSGLLAGYGVAIPVGAIGVLILSLAARTSLGVGAAAALGVAAADGLYALLAVAGGGVLAGAVRPIAAPLRWCAAVVLAGLAVRTAVGAVRSHRDPGRAGVPGGALRDPGRAFLGLLGLTLLNPATVIYFSALVLGRQSAATRTLPGAAAWVVAVLVASASWQLLLAAGGSSVGRTLAGPRGRLATAFLSSLLITLLAVRLIFVS